jgi:quinol monooxygenase YgiN
MNTFRAVAIFPHIEPRNLDEFRSIAALMMVQIQKQSSILRYDMFFNEDNTRCVVLEEFANPEAVIEHVQKNTELLQQLTKLGGKIEGSVFPMDQSGAALQEIKTNWDSKFHTHFLGKTS